MSETSECRWLTNHTHSMLRTTLFFLLVRMVFSCNREHKVSILCNRNDIFGNQIAREGSGLENETDIDVSVWTAHPWKWKSTNRRERMASQSFSSTIVFRIHEYTRQSFCKWNHSRIQCLRPYSGIIFMSSQEGYQVIIMNLRLNLEHSSHSRIKVKAKWVLHFFANIFDCFDFPLSRTIGAHSFYSIFCYSSGSRSMR